MSRKPALDAAVPAGEDSWAIYRRLLGYARPFLGKFAIGVCGMILFAATESALAWLVRRRSAC